MEQLRRDFKEVYLLRPVTGEVVSLAGALTRMYVLGAYLATVLSLCEEARGLDNLRPEYAEEGLFEEDDKLAPPLNRRPILFLVGSF